MSYYPGASAPAARMERSGIRISYSRRLSFPPDFAALHPGYSTPARSNSGRGFTLIELMVVVVILGILAAVVVPRVMDRPEQARISATKNNIRAIRSALDMYKLDNHYYPTTDQGLEALVQRPDGQPQPPNWTRYMEKIPFDPWGNNYFYLQPGKYGDVDVFSPGPNGRTGDEDDIGSWQL